MPRYRLPYLHVRSHLAQAPVDTGVGPPPLLAMALTWAAIVELAAAANMQPKQASNEALKHFRDEAETNNIHAVHIPLTSPTVLVRKCTHGRGEQFIFEAHAPLVPWNWAQMLVRLGPKGQEIVGSGLSGLALYQRPNSYDHHRANAIVKNGGTVAGPLPIWDFLVTNADGRQWLLHPRWAPKAKCDIISLADAGALLGTIPAKGLGRSDGPGTYRRATATYTEAVPHTAAPAEAGHPPPVLVGKQWQPPPPPPPPGHPQNIPQQVAHLAAEDPLPKQRLQPPPPQPPSQATQRVQPPPPPPLQAAKVKAPWVAAPAEAGQPPSASVAAASKAPPKAKAAFVEAGPVVSSAMSSEEPLELQGASWWKGKKFAEETWNAKRQEHELDAAAQLEAKRAKEQEEFLAKVKQAKEVLPAKEARSSGAPVEAGSSQSDEWDGWSLVSESDVEDVS